MAATASEKHQIVAARRVEPDLLAARGFAIDDPRYYTQTTFPALLAAHNGPEDLGQLSEALSATYEASDGRVLVVRYILIHVTEEHLAYLLGLSDTLRPLDATAYAVRFRQLRTDLLYGRDVDRNGPRGDGLRPRTNIIISLHDISGILQNTILQKAPLDLPWHIQVFSVSELQINPMRHVLVPHHRLLSPEEVEKLGVAPQQMPEQKVSYRQQTPASPSSPAAKFLGLRDGDVVAVLRRNYSTLSGENRLSYSVIREVTA